MSTVHHLPEQVAERYGVTVDNVKRNVRLKRWPHLRVGKYIRFTDEHLRQIDALLEVPVSQEAKAANSWGRKTRGGAA